MLDVSSGSAAPRSVFRRWAGMFSGRRRELRRRQRPRTGKRYIAALMSLPAFVLMGVFLLGPAVYGIWLSFTNKALVGINAEHTSFVGLANYRALFSTGTFVQSLGKSVEFVFFSAIVGQFVLGLLAAVLLSKPKVRFKGIFAAAILLPLVVPEVVASLAWASMLAPGDPGTVNKVIGLFGISPVEWLQRDPMLSIVVINIWRGIAFAMIMFQAAIAGIPGEVEESARVDGANAWQILRRITLPLIRGSVFLFMLVTTITTFSIFGLVYFLTQGGPGNATDVVGIFIYNNAFEFFEIGFGSAASCVLLAMMVVLGVVYVRLMKAEV
jgi:multiple sugar transport system permease protein